MGTGSDFGAGSDSRRRGRRRAGGGAATASGARRRAAVFAVACALVLLALLGALGVAEADVYALSPTPTDTHTWTGSGADQYWTTAANWSGSAAPAAGDSLVFPTLHPSSTNDFSAVAQSSGDVVSVPVAPGLTSTNNFAAGTQFGSISIGNNGYVFSGNAIKMSGGITATYASGSLILPLSIQLTQAQSFNIGSGATLYCNGVLTGAGALTKSGDGILHLNTNNPDYTGGLTVSAGVVDVHFGQSMGTGAVVVQSGAAGTVRLQSAMTVANAITINGSGTSGGGAIQANTGVSTWSGTITLGSDAAIGVAGTSLEISSIADSPYTLTKQSGGLLLVSGTPAFTGAFNVYGGTLRVDGLLPSTCEVTLYIGTTLEGTGTTGPVLVMSGCTLAPGHGDPGTLTVASVAMALPGGTFSVQLNGTTAGSGYDQLVSSGGVTLGATLSATVGYTPAIGDSYTIINKTGAGAVNGTFLGLAEGSSLIVGGKAFTISYVGGDGNDVVITRAQVPTTFSISAGNDQSAALGTAFATALKTRLLDENGDPVAGASVTFTAPASGASGTFASSSTVTTDADGYATAPAFTANTAPGSYSVTASSDKVTDLTFSLTNTPSSGQAPAITSAAAASFTEGGTGSFTVTTTGSPKAALTETGALPGGVTFADNGDGTATIGGTPAAGSAGDYALTIAAANGIGAGATQAFVLHVDRVNPGAPPVTTVRGAPSRWVRHSVRLTFAAEPGPGGAPVDYTEYRVGSGHWVRGDSVTVDRQGVTKVAYRSVSTAGEVEATQTCTLRIDSAKPVVANYGHPTCSQGGAARFAFRVTDAGASLVRAELVITRYGHHVRTIDLGRQETGKRLVATVRCGLPVGTWNWRIVVHNAAGARGAGHPCALEVYPR